MPDEIQLPPPTTVALVLCDNVYRDSHGKMALIGLFDRIVVNKTPAVHPRMCVFVSITSIRANTVCRLDIVNAETDEPIIVMEGPAPDKAGPIAVWDIVFELPPLAFKGPGTYYVRFFGNDNILLQRPIEVIEGGDSQSEPEVNDKNNE